MSHCPHQVAIAEYCAACDTERSAPTRAPAPPRGIYVASRTRHAARWRALRSDGVPIASTWIDDAGADAITSLGGHWVRAIAEAKAAAALVAFAGPGETLQHGSLVEVGVALGHGVPVFVAGGTSGTWVCHPLVTVCSSLEEAIAHAWTVAARR
jgi:hypothetical protein